METQLDRHGYAPMQPVVITVRPTYKSKHHAHPMLELPPWCPNAKEVEAYYECFGPMQGECSVLLVNPGNPEGPKYRMMVSTDDIRALDAEAAPPPAKPKKRAPKDTSAP